MTNKIRRFWTKGVWNVFENGEFIGQVIKQHNGWKPTTPNSFTYSDLKNGSPNDVTICPHLSVGISLNF